MARFFGQPAAGYGRPPSSEKQRALMRAVAAGGRRVLSMECALVCLLLGLSVVGYATGLDRTTRSAASGLIAGLYEAEEGPAVRGVPIPKSAAAHVAPVQAQATRGQ